MSLLFSTTIRESNIPKYKQLRDYLKNKNISIGDYLISAYENDPIIIELDNNKK